MSYRDDQSVDTTRRSNRSPTPQQEVLEHAPIGTEVMPPPTQSRSPKRHRSPRQDRSRSSGHLHGSGRLVPTRSLPNMEDQIARKIKMEDSAKMNISEAANKNDPKERHAPQPPVAPFSPPPNSSRRGVSSKLEKANRAQEELRKKYAMHVEKRAKSSNELSSSSATDSFTEGSDRHLNQESAPPAVTLPTTVTLASSERGGISLRCLEEDAKLKQSARLVYDPLKGTSEDESLKRNSIDRGGISLSRLEEDAKLKRSARLIYDPLKGTGEDESLQRKPSDRGGYSLSLLEEDARQKRSARLVYDPLRRTDNDEELQQDPTASTVTDAHRSIKSSLLSDSLGSLQEIEAQIRAKCNGKSSQSNSTMVRLSSLQPTHHVSDQGRQQLESMENDLLVKGNVASGTKTRVLEARTGRQVINDPFLVQPAAAAVAVSSRDQEPDQNTSYFRRLTKALTIEVPAGALGPGAYRAGIYDSSSEDESMTNSDRLLYQTESERHLTNLAEAAREHQAHHRLQEQGQHQQQLHSQDQEQYQPQDHPSLQPSFSQQLGLGDVADFGYEQEASIQRIEIKGNRFCGAKWIVFAIIAAIGVGIGVSIVLAVGKGKPNPTEAQIVDDCIFDSKIMMDQCTRDGRVSNIPSCVLDRYGDVVRKLNVSTMEPIDSCSSSNLGILSMAAAGHNTIHTSMYVLSSFFFSTKGPTAWRRTDGWGVLGDVCLWYGIKCLEVCVTQANGMQDCKQDPEQISEIIINGNGLEGPLPTEVGLLSSLNTFDLQYNLIDGSIMTELSQLPQLVVLDMSDNLSLAGSIPSEIGRLTRLRTLRASTALLTGTIPTTIGLMKSLEILDFMTNKLSGTLPTEFGALTNLQSLCLNGNLLSGQIPTELSECGNLTLLDAARNRLSGFIPSEYGLLTRLTSLILQENRFLNSKVPIEIYTGLSNLEKLHFHYTEVSGSLPSEIGMLTALTTMFLKGNRFVGEIPTEIGLCQKLINLNFDQNMLSGTIPSQLGNLKVLQSFGFSDNRFTGSLPTELGLLTNLRTLSFQNNNFSGFIPEEVCSLTDNYLDLKKDVSFPCMCPYGGAMCPSSDCC